MRPNFTLEALEPRVLLSADPLLGVAAGALEAEAGDEPTALVETVDLTETTPGDAGSEARTESASDIDAGWITSLADPVAAAPIVPVVPSPEDER